MDETLRRSSLGALAPGDRVNLELPLRAGDRLGGHVVQGHVDGIGEVRVGRRGGLRARRADRAPTRTLLRYVVEKGSIAVDGVSLTVAAVDERRLRGLADPGDARAHDARRRRAGRPVNLEVDVLAKYVEKLRRLPMEPHEQSSLFSTIEEAIEDIRAGQDGRGLRRRGPRERGRPDAGGPVRHAGGDQLHGQARRAA